ncbi:MAG: LamG domain-containing protein [Firmicutes bacterium]|nr:LamG domain-containing protein [Bacillota bacterium]
MYQDKITVEVRAYMDDWSKYTSGMRLISCTDSGGWNVGDLTGGEMHFSCYDSGNGYKNVYPNLTFADLSAGWHTFKITFDGEYLRAYIDGQLVGTSAKYVSGKIGYNASNAIFVGAEAAGNSSTPEGTSGHFKGKIAYVRIENNVS